MEKKKKSAWWKKEGELKNWSNREKKLIEKGTFKKWSDIKNKKNSNSIKDYLD